MEDYSSESLPSPTNKYKKLTSSILSSPRFFTAFASKAFSETEAVMSPTSILDTKPLSCLKNPFWSENNTQKYPEADQPKHHCPKFDSQKIGLGILDYLSDEKIDQKLSKPESKLVLFGSQLKIQIPPVPPSGHSLVESPKSPAEFGIKTRNSLLSQSSTNDSPYGSASSGMDFPNSSELLNRSLSFKEMELSEDYTCIICHGPNPKTTHIFDNCIIGSCCGVVGLSDLERETGVLADGSSCPSESFLSFCYTCKKNLEQEKEHLHLQVIKHFAARNAVTKRCCWRKNWTKWKLMMFMALALDGSPSLLLRE